MNTRRLGLALTVALALSITVTTVFYMRVSKSQTVEKPQTEKIVAATAEISPGVPVTAEQVTLIDWPVAVPLEGKLTNVDDILGRPLAYTVGAREPILQRAVSSSGAGLRLAAKIPDGMRAAAVRTNEVNNIAGFLYPGARVDVLVTLRQSDGGTLARTALQNVQVLSVGSKMEPDPSGKPDNVSVVTLLVTPQESESLILAQSLGTIQLVLRNGGDEQLTAGNTLDLLQLSGQRRSAAPEMTPRKRVAAEGPKVHTVETVAGGKVSVASFAAKSE